MEIINGNDAYRISEETYNKAKQEKLQSYSEVFNYEVNRAAHKGCEFCILSWFDFGVKTAPTDVDFSNLAAFIEVLMDEDYEVEYYFHNPRHHDISGIIVAWGPNAEEQIDHFFTETEGDFYRGEEIGVH